MEALQCMELPRNRGLFFGKKYDANPALFFFILWIEGHLNIVFLVNFKTELLSR
jgi:hypothetical protein